MVVSGGSRSQPESDVHVASTYAEKCKHLLVSGETETYASINTASSGKAPSHKVRLLAIEGVFVFPALCVYGRLTALRGFAFRKAMRLHLSALRRQILRRVFRASRIRKSSPPSRRSRNEHLLCCRSSGSPRSTQPAGVEVESGWFERVLMLTQRK